MPEKLPAGNCSGILGWSQQETKLFLFWAKFSMYDFPPCLILVLHKHVLEWKVFSFRANGTALPVE